MKIKKLEFKGHKVLGDLEIDFTDEKTGEPLEIIAFIGDNGTGKTQVLETIVTLTEVEFSVPTFAGTYMEASNEVATLTIGNTKLVDNFVKKLEEAGNLTYKLVWLPADLNVNIQSSDKNQINSSDWVEHAKDWHLNDINDYIVKKMNRVARRTLFEGLSPDTYKNEIEEINEVFSNMDLNIKFIDLSDEDDPIPIFQNKRGDKFDIANLSSGEKQLFFRMLNLKRLNINNAIIVVDEPETSLHPEWQRKIIEMYKKIGENNQIIIATHSPLIVGSVPTESIRIMSRNDEGEIEVHQQDVYEKSHGKTADYILKVTMDLDTPRDVKTQENINRADELLQNNQYEIEEYKMLMQNLIEQLGPDDQDVLRLQMAQAVRMRKNAESK